MTESYKKRLLELADDLWETGQQGTDNHIFLSKLNYLLGYISALRIELSSDHLQLSTKLSSTKGEALTALATTGTCPLHQCMNCGTMWKEKNTKEEECMCPCHCGIKGCTEHLEHCERCNKERER